MSAPERSRRALRARALRDALLAGTVVLTGGVAFTHLDAAERLSRWVSRGEPFELDDVLLTLVLAVACATWLSVRRYQDVRRQAVALRASERERQRSVERLQALSERLISAEADERERLALVLHDAVSQPLYAACLRLDALLARSPEDEQRRLIEQARNLLEAALQEGRDLTTELSPPGLRELPVLDAMRTLATEIFDRYSIAIRIEPSDAWSAIDPCAADTVYHAARELLSNAGRHAGASEVLVRASWGLGGALHIEVQDDGCGFDPSAGETGFGLSSVAQRMRRAGGALKVTSEAGRGTRVRLTLPSPAGRSGKEQPGEGPQAPSRRARRPPVADC